MNAKEREKLILGAAHICCNGEYKNYPSLVCSVHKDIIAVSLSYFDLLKAENEEQFLFIQNMRLKGDEKYEREIKLEEQFLFIQNMRLKGDEKYEREIKLSATEKERDSWKTQWVECCENLDIVAKERDRYKDELEER